MQIKRLNYCERRLVFFPAPQFFCRIIRKKKKKKKRSYRVCCVSFFEDVLRVWIVKRRENNMEFWILLTFWICQLAGSIIDWRSTDVKCNDNINKWQEEKKTNRHNSSKQRGCVVMKRKYNVKILRVIVSTDGDHFFMFVFCYCRNSPRIPPGLGYYDCYL